MKRFLLLALTLLAAPAAAQSVTECDWKAQAGSIAEPWEDNSRTFANGDVRIALIDVGEPAVGGYHILVLSPPRAELGFRQCRIVTAAPYGFGGVSFDALQADYDPSRGLRFALPVRAVIDGAGELTDYMLTFTVNQATGEIYTNLSR